MIIGFMGKGGSGKTTLASFFVRRLIERGNTVLGIDADHNMDLAFNLHGTTDGLPHFGNAHAALKAALQLPAGAKLVDAVEEAALRFRVDPPDAFTAAYSASPEPKLRLMSAGPHTDAIWHDEQCSHSLFSPLKAYLPLLDLAEGQAAVVDCVAGTDAVGTGIATGMDHVFIVTEPTPHGLKAATQIRDGLRRFDVPHDIVINKSGTDADEAVAAAALGHAPSAVFPHLAERPAFDRVPAPLAAHIDALIDRLHARIAAEGSLRIARTKEKRDRNAAFHASAR